MAHLVRFRTPEGEVVTEEHSDLDSAVARVEALRNEGVVGDVSVWAEVPLRFETIVRVSVASTPSEPSTSPTPTPAAEPTEDTAPPTPPGPVEPPPGAMLSPVRVEAPSADADDLVDVESPGGEGKRGLFHRG